MERDDVTSRLAGLSAAKRALLERRRRGEAPVSGSSAAAIGRRTGTGPAPLSFAQQRLWLLDRLEPDSAAYTLRLLLRLSGPLDRQALAGAFQEVVRRHEVLRTAFRLEEAVALPGLDLPLPAVDLTGLPEGRREEEAVRQARELAARAFDLSRPPLLRIALFSFGESEHRLAVVLHHIVADGWSEGVLVRELAALYAGSPLPELPIQYADYAVWQRDLLQGEELETRLDWWRQELAGAPRTIVLPADRTRSASTTRAGGIARTELPADLSAAVEALARRLDATPFMVFLSVFQALLFRFTGEADLLVGTPVASRGRRETEDLIGLFVNTLVLRGRLGAGGLTFAGLLAATRERVLGAFEHQDLPFERLVEELAPERNLAVSPLFQVMFSQQPPSAGPVSLPGLVLTPVPLHNGEAAFDLSLDLRFDQTPTGGRWQAGLEFSRALFDATTTERLLRSFVHLLRGAMAAPERRMMRITELPLLDAAERHQIAREWAGDSHRRPVAPSVLDLFEEQVDRIPDAPALFHAGRRFTYGELDRWANRLAHRLRRMGVGPEVRVAVLLERSAEVIASFLGVLKAGGVYVPLDLTYPRDRLVLMLEDAEAAVLITEESARDLAARVRIPALFLADLADLRESPERPRWERNEEALRAGQLAYVIYTSGSTGRPKGVMVSHRALAGFAEAVLPVYETRPGDRMVQFCALSFDISFEEIVACLCGGAELMLRTEAMVDAAVFLEKCTEWGVTMTSLPTAFWHEMAAQLAAGATMPPALRLTIIGGERCLLEHVETWRRHAPAGSQIINTYGLAEGTITSTMRDLLATSPAEARGGVSSGRVITGTEILLLDGEAEPVPIGVPGEMCCGGTLQARGYFGRPALTAERFIPHPFAPDPGARLYRAGDLARVFFNGEIEVLGRIDRQVKVRGYRIELAEIETRLLQLPGVLSAVVNVYEPRPGDKQIVGYVVPVPGEEQRLEPAALRAALRKMLPDFMVPGTFLMLDALPLTDNGKVDRGALPPPAAGTAVGDDESYTPPSGPLEEILAGIWAEVLRVERVGAAADFFALGGHSLLAAQVVSRLRAALGVELPLRRLFEAPTVRELAREVRALAAGEGTLPPVVKVPRGGDGLPLSLNQQRLWLDHQLDPDNPAYNIPAAVRLAGAVDPAVLARVAAEVVRRHESLRTAFEVRDGRPVQVALPADAVPVPLVDLSALPAAAREAEALRIARGEAARPFDLRRGLLLRLTLVRLGAGEHLLPVTVHHIAADGWSMEILLREIAALYEAFAAGRPSPLPELPVQYGDFAVWQRRWLGGEMLEGAVRAWREQLSGMPRVLALPTDRPRPAVRSLRGAARAVHLPPGLATPLAELGQRAGATLFMTLLAAFAVLLGRLAGQEDFAVGTGVAGRDRQETEGLIGFFVNTLALRTDLTGDPGFLDLLARVRTTVLAAFAHQAMPFERLLEEVAPARDPSYPPLIQVVLSLESGRREPVSLPGLTLEPVPVDSGTAKYDLVLSLVETDGALAGWWEISTALFDAVTIDRWTGHLATLLASVSGITATPDLPLSELPLLAAAERHQLTVEWNDTAADDVRPPFVHELFAERARQQPEAPAVVDGERRVTYGELLERAGALASWLRSMGVGPEVTVALCAERSFEMVLGTVAVLQAGGAYLPLDPAHPPERLAFMIADSKAPVLLTQRRLAGLLPRGGLQVRFLEDPTDPTDPTDRSDLAAGHPAYVIYTSGSTGVPKGVVATHGALANVVRWHHAWSGLAAGHHAAQVAAPAFDGTVFEIWPCLTAGGCLHIADEETRLAPPRMIEWLARNEIACAYLPTRLIEAVLAEPWPAGMALRALNTAGDRLHRRPDASLPFGVHNLYGPTEITVLASGQRVAPAGDGPPPIGRPIANTRLHVVDRRLRPVPLGAPGEIVIGGAGVSRGYLARPELTAERFVPDPFDDEPGARLYRSGDLARRLPDGQLDFLGRVDLQVKIRGFRIEPGEIEAALGEHPAIQACAVAVLETGRNGGGDKKLAAYLVARAGEAPEAGALRGFLAAKLPSYMVPAVFVALPALPLSANGKVDRAALPPPPETGAGHQRVAPRTETETVLCRIWAEVLGLSVVGVHDNFFELGGDSILGIQVGVRAREAGLAMTARDLFQCQTVAELAAVVVAGEDLLPEGFPEPDLSGEDFASLMDQIAARKG